MSDRFLEKIYEFSADLLKISWEGTKVLWRTGIFSILVMGFVTLYVISPGSTMLPVIFCFFFGITFVMGLSGYTKKKKALNKLVRVGFKNEGTKTLSILSFNEEEYGRSKLVVHSEGYSVAEFKKEEANIENSFGLLIDEVKMGHTPQRVEIFFSEYRLPKIVKYPSFIPMLKKNCQFAIGQTSRGNLVEDLSTLPHLLIAGTTGRGKSVYFKQVLLSLLKSTSHLQLYLIDLKRGIEMKDFSILPNVVLAKEERGAVDLLQRIHDEMMRRFEYLEKNNLKSIDPERDKIDRIVVGVDEASVLFTIKSSHKTKEGNARTARDLTDDIAKLGRAAGIHLILATQKVTKETIDTKIQENIGGRICFRVNTLSNSLTVLGNGMAYKIQDLPGRAIYSYGNEFLEVQTPFLKDEELENEMKNILDLFMSGERKVQGVMITELVQNVKQDLGKVKKNFNKNK